MVEREAGMSVLGTVYLRCLQRLGRLLEYGTVVFDRDWDVLVVLDGCRPETLEAVARDVDYIDRVERLTSVGSCSSEWLENTFEKPAYSTAVARTAMVTGNTWTSRYLDETAFLALDEVWKYAWDDDLGTVPAAAVTERAVAVDRTHGHDRLVVHYMQPHHPFVPDPLAGDSGIARTGAHSSDSNPWVLLRRGAVSVERVRRAYRANLEYVLRSVERLRANVTGKVVITADHANLFGEWGLYGHPMHTPVPELITVPWVETTGTGEGTLDPTLEPPEQLPVSRVYGETSGTDRLHDLGYLR